MPAEPTPRIKQAGSGLEVESFEDLGAEFRDHDGNQREVLGVAYRIR